MDKPIRLSSQEMFALRTICRQFGFDTLKFTGSLKVHFNAGLAQSVELFTREKIGHMVLQDAEKK